MTRSIPHPPRFRRRLALVLALAVAAGACAPAVRGNAPVPAAAADAWVSDRLYFGRNIPGGGLVSDEAWAEFLRDVVTPSFPSGLTVWRGEGQWRDSTGATMREPAFILERLHAPGDEADAALARIVEEYKRRFRQESVLHVRAPAAVRLMEEE